MHVNYEFFIPACAQAVGTMLWRLGPRHWEFNAKLGLMREK